MCSGYKTGEPKQQGGLEKVWAKMEARAAKLIATHKTANPHTRNTNPGFDPALEVLRRGVQERAFPGAAAAAVHSGHLALMEAIGRFTYEESAPLVSPETVFDLASLTKVVATAPVAMLLYERGMLRLEQRVADVIPEFIGPASRPKEDVNFEMLLTHTSGLPAYAKLYLEASNRQEMIDAACAVELEVEPGTRSAYSDIGFILLGFALERIAGEKLDHFCAREIFDPLQMKSTAFNPPTQRKSEIPPTANDQSFRQRVIQGEVHDENASAMGGVAGHAGVFSNVADLAKFAMCLLRGGAPIFKHETVEKFTRRAPTALGSYALGWDTPSQPSQSGKYLSSRAYGHLGFTGTSLWIDPERDLAIVLLTNRTWPDAKNEAIKQIRPAFHDAVFKAVSQK